MAGYKAPINSSAGTGVCVGIAFLLALPGAWASITLFVWGYAAWFAVGGIVAGLYAWRRVGVLLGAACVMWSIVFVCLGMYTLDHAMDMGGGSGAMTAGALVGELLWVVGWSGVTGVILWGIFRWRVIWLYVAGAALVGYVVMAAGGLFWAAIPWNFVMSIGVLHWAERERHAARPLRRIDRGECFKCAYPTKGLSICPECGEAVYARETWRRGRA